MADVRAFRGLRYDPHQVSIEKVVAQPYDKISPEMQERYYALDPHNVVRITLGKTTEADSPENNVYTRAAATLKAWRESGVIKPLTASSFIVYFQRFVVPGSTEERIRKG